SPSSMTQSFRRFAARGLRVKNLFSPPKPQSPRRIDPAQISLPLERPADRPAAAVTSAWYDDPESQSQSRSPPPVPRAIVVYPVSDSESGSESGSSYEDYPEVYSDARDHDAALG
ncbi:unnamed protein product, partial [Mycena citricolor]